MAVPVSYPTEFSLGNKRVTFSMGAPWNFMRCENFACLFPRGNSVGYETGTSLFCRIAKYFYVRFYASFIRLHFYGVVWSVCVCVCVSVCLVTFASRAKMNERIETPFWGLTHVSP